MNEDCLRGGCKHVVNEPHEDKFQIWKICKDCGRRVAILSFEPEQWAKLKEEGRILVK